MDWLGLHFLAELPANGQLLLDCNHDLVLVVLAYLIACAACFATLDMAERLGHAEKPQAQTLWCWLGAMCLAVGVWAMHFINMLAFQMPIDSHYDLRITVASLLIALVAGLVAMRTLSRHTPSLGQHGEYGCDYAQGYLFSKPAPLEVLRPLLQELNQRKPASLWPASLSPQASGINTTGNLFAESPDSPDSPTSVSALHPCWVIER
ncbi:MAG: diguanylate phosphodiesterase [Pseudomonas sp.]|nr:diguanylate phosphodiesterase [Pseudomonas sp.]